MAQIRNYEFTCGTTKKLTWVSSGSVPTEISCAILDRSNTIVSSITATSSGNGHYYALVNHPTTPGYYVNEWRAIIQTHEYISRQFGLGRGLEVG